jgi:hypothetical protein
VVVALALVPVPVLVAATPASACTCYEDPGVQASFDAADVVVSGTMSAVRVASGDDGDTHEIAVATVHKGESAATLRYLTPGDDVGCGFWPSVGTEVLVFLRDGESGPSTYLCAGNRTGSLPADEQAVVDGWPSSAPQADAVDGGPPRGVAIAAVVVGGGGLVALAVWLATRRRRQRP